MEYMQKIDAFRKFNEIIKSGEDKLKMFHTVRSKVDSYRRVIHAVINKRVYQKCVDELQITHGELSAFELKVNTFYTENKSSFSGIMKHYSDSYMKYISAAVNVSEKRLILQKLILDIKVNKTMKHYQCEIPRMIEDINKSCENCRLHAVSFNKVADKIKNA
jgi:hypothetical protein